MKISTLTKLVSKIQTNYPSKKNPSVYRMKIYHCDDYLTTSFFNFDSIRFVINYQHNIDILFYQAH